jgi:glucokinase
VQEAINRLNHGANSSLRQILEARQELTAKWIYEQARAGDVLSQELIQELAGFLAVGIVSVSHTVDPEIVVLGGAMDFGGNDCPVGRSFLEHVRSEFRRQTFPVLAEKTVIDFARLGGDAGYIGAAGLAREAYYGRSTRIF